MCFRCTRDNRIFLKVWKINVERVGVTVISSIVWIICLNKIYIWNHTSQF